LIPTDLYFSDLDGDWNADGDGYWGEWPDDEVDLYADVFVSRFPVVAPGFVDVVVGKTLTYEKEIPAGHTTRALFLGARLDSYTWGGDCKDYVAELVPDQFKPITKLYQKLGNISRAAVIAQMNAGNCAVVNHAAHANYTIIGTGPDNMSGADAYALTNGDKLGWMYSIGCMCGGFDRYQSFAENIVLAPEGGMVAAIMNSRYGWYTPNGPGIGPSDRLDQAYFRAMFQKGMTNFGYALADMRDQWVPAAKGNAYYRWCIYENNVIGPNETLGWTDQMQTLAVEHPDHWSHGGFPVSVTAGGSPVKGALVCLFKEGDCYVTGRTDASGQLTLYPDASEPGEMLVTVTGQNVWPYEGATTVDDDVSAGDVRFAGAAGEEGVLLSWRLEETAGLAGVNLYRNAERLNTAPLAPEAGGRYLDRAARGVNDYYLELVQADGAALRYGPISVSALGETAWLALSAAYPNPAAGLVSFDLELPADGSVELAIYDLSGRRVATAASGELAAGRHTVSWDAGGAPAGVYIARLVTADGALTTRLVIAR
ncbi:MAG TPA: T9SS type A sorting domain-containing protein, partial [Candidatus Coatesbacteria bacterium]|nr:T9SS type A sorting domain-containing protein [Candidatus Coatesbacteria bacterium]